MKPYSLGDSVECHFCVDIHAPQGLRGLEPHLRHSGLALLTYQSGYNGKLIFRAQGDADFEWLMDSSDDARMFASGAIRGDAQAAEDQLRKLSTVLSMAGYPHRILLDDPSGNLHASIEHEWPPDRAP
jgi:hypothetical protein